MNPINIDAVLSAVRGEFQRFQVQFIGERGRCWRSGWTHSDVPEVATAADLSGIAVDPSGIAWAGALPNLAGVSLGFRALCNEYVSTAGVGYFLVVQTVHEGVVRQKVYDFGPEPFATDWYDVPPDLVSLQAGATPRGGMAGRGRP